MAPVYQPETTRETQSRRSYANAVLIDRRRIYSEIYGLEFQIGNACSNINCVVSESSVDASLPAVANKAGPGTDLHGGRNGIGHN